MKKETKIKLLKILYLSVIVLFIMYIFSNSLESKSVSSNKSNEIVVKINTTLEKINSDVRITDLFVRKSAHFIEFFTLGVLIFGYNVICKNFYIKNQIYACFLCCLIAMTDETIQYFSKRGSMLLDVWLDLFAATCSIMLLFAIHKIRNKK